MVEGESRPEYGWKIDQNVLIPLSDGVNLASDSYVPTKDGRVAEGKFPAIIGNYNPYHKDLNRGGFNGSSRHDMGIYFASHGYRVFFVDVRGTGNSEGRTDRLYSDQEQRDSYEVVEWLAGQPWCNGSVGMYGVSYGFYSTVLCAATAPPHLKAIVPFSGGFHWYTAGWGYEGGNFSMLHFTGMYASHMIAMNYMPPEYQDPQGRWLKIWKQHTTENTPWFLAWLENEVDGPYYYEGSISQKYDKIKAAALVLNGWHDYYPSEPIKFFQHVKSPKKLIAGPWMHELPDRARPGPRIHILHEMLRWYDHWLKGIDTGVMQDPPVSIYVQDYTHPDVLRDPNNSWQNGSWRLEDEWPLRGTAVKPLYLAKGRSLDWNSPSGAGSAESLKHDPSAGIATGLWGGVYDPVGLPLDQRYDDRVSLVYGSEPLEGWVEVTGQPRAVLYASSTADVASFVVKLCDQAPDGTTVLVSRWSLNGTHRESDTDPEPMTPGEVYELRIDMCGTSYRFAPGHRIKLYVASSDFPFLWPTPKPAVNTVHSGPQYPSRIELPIVPPRKDPKTPNFLPPPVPSRIAEVPEPHYWRVVQDMNNGNVTLEWGNRVIFKPADDVRVEAENRLWQTVNTKNPALASMDSRTRFTVRRPHTTIATESEVLITSDEANFNVLSGVEVTQGSECVPRKDWALVIHKEWDRTYPRGFR